jgi:hypothetical protein
MLAESDRRREKGMGGTDRSLEVDQLYATYLPRAADAPGGRCGSTP